MHRYCRNKPDLFHELTQPVKYFITFLRIVTTICIDKNLMNSGIDFSGYSFEIFVNGNTV